MEIQIPPGQTLDLDRSREAASEALRRATLLATALIGTAALVLIIAMSGIFSTAPGKRPVDCKQDVQCYINFSLDRMEEIGTDINYWSNLLTYSVLATLVCGTITTLSVGLQNEINKWWFKPVGLISTAVGAAFATMATTFHVQDNIDKLIEIRSRLADLTDKLILESQGKSGKPLDAALITFSASFRKEMNERTKLKGSAGRLNVGIVAREQSTDRPR